MMSKISKYSYKIFSNEHKSKKRIVNYSMKLTFRLIQPIGAKKTFFFEFIIAFSKLSSEIFTF